LPLLLTALTVVGLFKLLAVFLIPITWPIALTVAFLPAVAIHTTRFFPDLLMLASLVWAIVAWLHKKPFAALLSSPWR
jgi:apolipoprotein N-acyltransferase